MPITSSLTDGLGGGDSRSPVENKEVDRGMRRVQAISGAGCNRLIVSVGSVEQRSLEHFTIKVGRARVLRLTRKTRHKAEMNTFSFAKLHVYIRS